MYRIAIIDDHRVLLDGLKGVVEEEENISAVDTYWQVEDFLSSIKQGTHYDLLITDIQMPGFNGLELIKELKDKDNDLRVMVMSMLDTAELIHSLLSLGISGYFLKGNGANELRSGIASVLRNESWFSPEIRSIIKDYKEGGNRPVLSPREIQIAVLTSKGKTAREISEELNLSHFTVQTHRKNIFRKLEVHNTAELVHCLADMGIG